MATAYSATHGVPPYTFSILSGTFPPGLTLDPSTGDVTGTPTVEGSYSWVVRVTDSAADHADHADSNVIAPSPAFHITNHAPDTFVGYPLLA